MDTKKNKFLSNKGFVLFAILALIVVLAAIFVIPLFIATIPANIAKKKGRNFAGYYLFGYFAFIPALIVMNLNTLVVPY